MRSLPEHQGCLKDESLNRFNILVHRCALVLGMDGGRTCGEDSGPTQASSSPFLGIALPKGSGDTWGRVCLVPL